MTAPSAPAGRGAGAADPFAASLVSNRGMPAVLRRFNEAGVLVPADVHTAVRLARLGGETREEVLLAVALAVRAPRAGHVSVDLRTISSSIVGGDDLDLDFDLDELPWPDPAEWVDAVRSSGLLATPAAPDRPFIIEGGRLYLDRYWRDEVAVGRDLVKRAAASGPDEGLPADRFPGVPPARVDELFPEVVESDQRGAARTAVDGRLTVIAGGPGTGKTTTVARILGLLVDAAGADTKRPPLIALAAPTGKAAARLEEAVKAEAATMNLDGRSRERMQSLSGTTLHRLLGSRPNRLSGFRYHRGHRLPHDVVVVDEASMVSLALMARLLDAVRPDARLILVGDPDQLVSVEAGAVLADIVGRAGRPSAASPGGGADRGAVTVSDRVRVLTTNHRFTGVLGDLATAVRDGRPDDVVDLLGTAGGAGAGPIGWIRTDPGEWLGGRSTDSEMEALVEDLATWAGSVVAAARAGNGADALALLRSHRLLCAHRRGPAGVGDWNRVVENRVGAAWPDLLSEGSWYAGRPVLVTANDYSLRLFNGDTGLVVTNADADDGVGVDRAPVSVVFAAGGGDLRRLSPYRLPEVETVFAMTVHKSQGSEFDRVTLLLPGTGSRLLTREMLYTALTRARQAVTVVGTAESIRSAVERPIARASGLAERLDL